MNHTSENTLHGGRLAAWAASCVCFQSCWALTVGFVPGRMQFFGASEMQIGFLLSIPPLVSLGELFFGKRGDQRVQHGRSRNIFLFWGALCCTIGACIMASQAELFLFTIGLLLLWFGCSAYESNQLALLSEKIPQTQRTQALSFSVLFRSALSLIYFLLIPIYLSSYVESAPYLLAACSIPIAMLLTVYGLPDLNITPSKNESQDRQQQGSITSFFTAHFFWTFSIQAIVVFFQLFLINELLNSDAYTDKETTATLIMGAVPLSGLLWAIALPKLCKYIGLKSSICLCVALIIPIALLCYFAESIILILVAEALAGLTFVGIAALPMSLLTEIQDDKQAGTYAAYFAITIVLAQISASLLIGTTVEFTESYRIIFPIAAVSAICALVVFIRSFYTPNTARISHE